MTRTTSDQESQMESPLASKNDAVSTSFEPFKPRHKETSKCFVYALALFVAVSAVTLIFALIFLRASAPEAELTSVTVKNLRHASRAANRTNNASTAALASLSVTLTASIAVENMNFGRFEYANSTASVFFEGVEIGRGAVARGRVGGRGRESVRVVVEVRTRREVENSTSFSEGVESGVVRLTSYGELRGRVHLINRLEKEEVSIVSCSMNLNLRNQTVEELVC